MSTRTPAAVALLTAFAAAATLAAAPAQARQNPAAALGGAPPQTRRVTPEELAARSYPRIEKAVGKPLTAAQKAAITKAYAERIKASRAVTTKFNADIAKAVGMDVATLRKKMAASRGQGAAPAAVPAAASAKR